MRRLMLLTILGMSVMAPSAYATPLVPKPLTDVFPANFFETVNCAMLRRGQRLTVDPMSLPPGKTVNIAWGETKESTQAERRVMAQTKLYLCTVDALQAIELALQLARPQLTATAYATAYAKLQQAREGSNWPTTPGWEALSLLKYGQGVRNVLFYTAGPNLYTLVDASYPWTYPDNAIILINGILTIFAQNHVQFLSPPLSPDLQTFLTQTYSMAGHPTNTSIFVSNENVYFVAPLNAQNPVDQTIIDQLETVEQFHADAGAALVCTYERGEASCPLTDPLDPARVACIRAAGIAAGCPNPTDIHDDEHDVEIENAATGVPTIAPTTRGVHPSLTLAEVCISVQRAHFAYHDWMVQVRDFGDTLAGFHNAWMASLGHAQIHVERTLGMMAHGMPPLSGYDVTDPLNPTLGGPKGDFRMPYEIRKYVYAKAPGVVNGTCNAYWLPTPQ